jgi:hypothetical protein
LAVSRQDDEFVRRASERFTLRLAGLVERYRREGRSVAEVLGDPEGLAERALAGQAPVPSPWDELVGPFFRSEGVQARLGISRQAVAAKAARRRLLRVFTSDGVALFPAWQFDGPQLIPGLGEVLSVFPEAAVDGWTLAGWLRTPDADLDGGVPVELLVAGEAQRVLTAARSASAALAA